MEDVDTMFSIFHKYWCQDGKFLIRVTVDHMKKIPRFCFTYLTSSCLHHGDMGLTVSQNEINTIEEDIMIERKLIKWMRLMEDGDKEEMMKKDMFDYPGRGTNFQMISNYRGKMEGLVSSEMKNQTIGDVAQMVERPLCMREVQGSIPCISKVTFGFTYLFLSVITLQSIYYYLLTTENQIPKILLFHKILLCLILITP
ncbi:transmembrane protein, putative [Medicago truncatula]|uniref:Transmembrane protein, putative n=1 Tax=Medicago truncatula TaxID=3880 RepID=G7JU95_MEDTR|nr:transmembrane protein, putative [Medicago truncatula]